MPKRSTSEYSNSYRDDYSDEVVDDSRQSDFSPDNQPDDWHQTDFAHRFTDELKAVNDTVAADFDSGKKLTEYSTDDRQQLAFATAEAFRNMDFDSDEARVHGALELSHTAYQLGPASSGGRSVRMIQGSSCSTYQTANRVQRRFTVGVLKAVPQPIQAVSGRETKCCAGNRRPPWAQKLTFFRYLM